MEDLPCEIFFRIFKGWLSKEEFWYDPSFFKGGMYTIIREPEFGRPRRPSILNHKQPYGNLPDYYILNAYFNEI